MLGRAYVEITNICNLSCSFCHKTQRAGRMMSLAEFELILLRLRGQVKELYFHLMGEPTLHPELPLFVGMARESGFLPMITTNGSRLSIAPLADALIEAHPHRISISLHAPAANPAFSDAGYLDSCIDFARRAAEADIFAVLRLWNLGSAEEASNTEIIKRLKEEFPGEWTPRRGGESYRIADRIFLEWGEEFDWPDYGADAIAFDEDLYCHALRQQIGVLVDGSVVPCCLDAEGALCLGNIFELELESILRSPRACAIRDGFGRRRGAEELCRRCGYARRFKRE